MTREDQLGIEGLHAKADYDLELDRKRIQAALDLIEGYGGIDGAHHKMWVIDQVVRVLHADTIPDIAHGETVPKNPAYEAWVVRVKAGEDGPETYGWDEGIAP